MLASIARGLRTLTRTPCWGALAHDLLLDTLALWKDKMSEVKQKISVIEIMISLSLSKLVFLFSFRKKVSVSDMIILPLWETGPCQGMAHLLALANANTEKLRRGKKNQYSKW